MLPATPSIRRLTPSQALTQHVLASPTVFGCIECRTAESNASSRRASNSGEGTSISSGLAAVDSRPGVYSPGSFRTEGPLAVLTSFGDAICRTVASTGLIDRTLPR